MGYFFISPFICLQWEHEVIIPLLQILGLLFCCGFGGGGRVCGAGVGWKVEGAVVVSSAP